MFLGSLLLGHHCCLCCTLSTKCYSSWCGVNSDFLVHSSRVDLYVLALQSLATWTPWREFAFFHGDAKRIGSCPGKVVQKRVFLASFEMSVLGKNHLSMSLLMHILCVQPLSETFMSANFAGLLSSFRDSLYMKEKGKKE